MNSDRKVLKNCELKKEKTIIAACNNKWPPLSSSSFRGRNRMEQFSSGRSFATFTATRSSFSSPFRGRKRDQQQRLMTRRSHSLTRMNVPHLHFSPPLSMNHMNILHVSLISGDMTNPLQSIELIIQNEKRTPLYQRNNNKKSFQTIGQVISMFWYHDGSQKISPPLPNLFIYFCPFVRSVHIQHNMKILSFYACISVRHSL